MEEIKIDINADVGEIVRNETLLMPYLSSCNIACGGHAGNAKIMEEVITLAKNNKVKIGAHPSFPDRLNFGRKALDISNQELFYTVKKQLIDLQKIVAFKNARLNHVKPHGALYNLVAKNAEKADIIIDVIKAIGLPISIYAPYKSVMANLAVKNGIDVKHEAFMDRSYNDDLSLVSRTDPHALLTNSEDIFNHLQRIICNQKVKTINGSLQTFKADTYCIHGDNMNAVDILHYITLKLKEKKITVL